MDEKLKIKMDVLLSWNFKHLANINKEQKILGLNKIVGYNHPFRIHWRYILMNDTLEKALKETWEEGFIPGDFSCSLILITVLLCKQRFPQVSSLTLCILL